MNYRINAIKGVQAGLPYFTCMISIWQLMSLLDMTNAKLPAEKRAQENTFIVWRHLANISFLIQKKKPMKLLSVKNAT